MLTRNAAIIFAIIGIAIIIGFICGVAPGIVLTSYALFGIALGLLFLIIILLIITILIIQYKNKNQIFFSPLIYIKVFKKGLSRNEKILFHFANALCFASGVLLGVLCELLLKAISASLAAHITIAAIFLLILLILLIIILILELKDSKKSKIYIREQQPVLVESNTRSEVLTKPQDRPKKTAARSNHYRASNFDDDSGYKWQDSSFNDSTTHSKNNFNISKPPSTIQREYQKLLHPSPRFYLGDKVYANDSDLAEIIEVDGLGNYRIQYFDNGLIAFKNGSELRKALPYIS